MTSTTTTIATATTPTGDIIDVTIHPLVLLSAADHYHRVARGTRKRVVGALLGTVHRGKIDATNSFAVPFEEDNKNPAVFYLDHNYLENMMAMFRKVNGKERIVGFYSTGPQIRPSDLRIYDIVTRFTAPSSVIPPVFCIIDVRPDRQSIPTTAYKVVEDVAAKTTSVASSNPGAKSSSKGNDSGNQEQRQFAHVPCRIGAVEAEEVGVEHLLRDINDPTVSTVAGLIKAKIAGLSTLTEKLVECKDYLENVLNGKHRQMNQEISSNLQTILNLLPNLNRDDLVRSMLMKTNDMHMAIYLSSLIRSVIALHDLVNNKIQYGQQQQQAENDAISTNRKKITTKEVAEEKKDDSTTTTTKAKK
mmetsp:Transcript_19169/g.21915  ORF Transcript_19169/g.21915 Transcript_19169/m.21915 type:complete len:361 (-) Transcript_19169:160-1242(-)|eukprot:CAMPEP_0194133234 /NCGR_PEP_ID=MMETSP0152-20130528/3490_1 /TAXON_ID=1049557 /ORGANISM="Thalassiothrix antarctica, Strain L6-D1" /LENGTH=360 /DNA_ID=CAMNT_0038828511 /DNA_START=158 /DNA_END=1240 /DNA_ORIENTATION=+